MKITVVEDDRCAPTEWFLKVEPNRGEALLVCNPKMAPVARASVAQKKLPAVCSYMQHWRED